MVLRLVDAVRTANVVLRDALGLAPALGRVLPADVVVLFRVCRDGYHARCPIRTAAADCACACHMARCVACRRPVEDAACYDRGGEPLCAACAGRGVVCVECGNVFGDASTVRHRGRGNVPVCCVCARAGGEVCEVCREW